MKWKYTTAFIFPLLVLAASPTYAKVINCDKGHSLQAAVDTAVDGAVLEVSGTCMERIEVDNDGVEIVGVGNATVIGPPDSFGTFFVRGRRVIIEGFTIRGEIGVNIDQGGSAEIRNNIIEDVTNVGILVRAGSYGNVRSNDVTGNGSFSGIFLDIGASADIHDNTVTNPNGSAIGIEGNSSAVVNGNTVSGSDSGISVTETSYIIILGGNPNTLEGNVFGVSCSHDSVIRVDEAQIFINNGTDGLQFDGCNIRNFVGAPFPLP